MAKTESKAKGFFFGILAAVSYGVNPLGAKYLYEEGMNVESVLFYRYGLAFLIIAAIMGVKILIGKKAGKKAVGNAPEGVPATYESFKVTRKELETLVWMGLLFVVSSLTLYCSFLYMDSGVACSLLFIYPVMTAVLMALLYGEKITKPTAIAIVLSLAGVILLYQGDGETTLSTVGVLLVIISALSYAIYIIVANRTSIPEAEFESTHSKLSKHIPLLHRSVVHRLNMSAMKLSLYVLMVCAITCVAFSFTSPERHIMPLVTGREWGFALMLALVPSVISLVSMGIAVRIIGSTPTAIMGALEPLTAVVIGLTVFKETFTVNLAFGILLILTAVITIIVSKARRA